MATTQTIATYLNFTGYNGFANGIIKLYSDGSSVVFPDVTVIVLFCYMSPNETTVFLSEALPIIIDIPPGKSQGTYSCIIPQ